MLQALPHGANPVVDGNIAMACSTCESVMALVDQGSQANQGG